MPPRPPRRPSCWPGSPVCRCLACWCRRWRSPGCCSACTTPATWPAAWQLAQPSQRPPPGSIVAGPPGDDAGREAARGEAGLLAEDRWSIKMSREVGDVDKKVAGPPANLIVGVVKAVRPRQWVKNILVAAAPLAALGTDVHHDWTKVLVKVAVAFVVFCLAASSIYLVNDVRDRDADRQHPTKRFRPIAAGLVPMRLAIWTAVVLLAAGIGVGAAVNWRLGLVVAIYVAESLCYSLGAKRLSVIELA